MRKDKLILHFSLMRWFTILCFFVFLKLSVLGQDLHFSQGFENPMFLNPALTSCSKCSLLAGLIYRNQWANIDMPIKTYSAFLETKYQPDFMYRDHFGIGGYIYNDVAGDSPLKTTGFVINAALKKFVGWGRDTLYFSAGVGIGGGQRSLNFEKLNFASQWNGINVSNTLPADLSNYNSNVGFVDFNGGINLYYSPYKKSTQYSAGLSLMHINQPDLSFLKSGTIKDPLQMKMTFHTRVFQKVSENTSLMAGALYSSQGDHNEFLLGANISNCITRGVGAAIKINDETESPVSLVYGLWLRMGPLRDISPNIGLSAFGFNLLMSYDIPMFNSAHVVDYKGSMEISLTKNIGCKYKPKCNCKEWGF